MRLQPHDHIGWVFSGPEEFAHLSKPFLADGLARGELLMYVDGDPDPDLLRDLADIAAPGGLRLASIAEVYGASGIVDPQVQRVTFAEVLAEARGEGYSGIRVAADNTPLVLDEERLAAWIAWEVVADRFMSESPVTGLCAFDRRQVDVDRLRHLATLHPLSSASEPEPQFRMFADEGALLVDGEVDAFAIDQVRLALDLLPPKTDVVIDLSSTVLFGRTLLRSITELCASGVRVAVRGASEAMKRMGDLVGMPEEGFSWESA